MCLIWKYVIIKFVIFYYSKDHVRYRESNREVGLSKNVGDDKHLLISS